MREEALKPWVPAQSKAKRSLVYGFLLSVTDISVGEMYFTHPRVKPQSMCSPCPPSIPHLAANLELWAHHFVTFFELLRLVGPKSSTARSLLSFLDVGERETDLRLFRLRACRARARLD